jgi:hypothetical protein
MEARRVSFLALAERALRALAVLVVGRKMSL